MQKRMLFFATSFTCTTGAIFREMCPLKAINAEAVFLCEIKTFAWCEIFELVTQEE